MILYELFKTLSDNVMVLIYNQQNTVVFCGSLYDIHTKYLMCIVTHITPLADSELEIDIIER